MRFDKALDVVSMQATLLQWMTLHGNLSLALRHPQNQGAARQIAIELRNKIALMLVIEGIMTEEEINQAHQLEDDARRRARS